MVEMEAGLYEAAEIGHVEKLREYLNSNIWEQVSPAGNTALHIAAYHGHFDFIRCLLSEPPQATMQENKSTFLKARNNRGNTALHEAARGGDYQEMVKNLHKLEAGLISIRNDSDESALFTAASNGLLHTARFLVSQGSAMYITSQGETPLHQALYHRHYGLVKYFIDNYDNSLASEADNKRGWTALHLVASNSNCPMWLARMILTEITDPSLCNKTDKVNQQTALHIAAKEGNVQIVKIILEFGRSSAEIEDGDGRTALHLAVENAQMRVVSLLLRETQRLVNIPDKNGITALDIALEKSGRGELTFLYELIIYLLTRNNKEESWKLKQKRRAESSPSEDLSKSETSQAINTISINAVLICTVTFAAAFTPPGGTKPNGQNGIFSVLGDSAVFQAFVVFDALAFCTSIIAAIILVYANGIGRMTAISFSAKLLPLSLYTMMASFTLAIYMFVASGCLWLAVFVIAVMIITCLFTFTVTIAYLQPVALLLPAYNHFRIAFQERWMDFQEMSREETIKKIQAHAQAVRAAHRFRNYGEMT